MRVAILLGCNVVETRPFVSRLVFSNRHDFSVGFSSSQKYARHIFGNPIMLACNHRQCLCETKLNQSELLSCSDATSRCLPVLAVADFYVVVILEILPLEFVVRLFYGFFIFRLFFFIFFNFFFHLNIPLRPLCRRGLPPIFSPPDRANEGVSYPISLAPRAEVRL